MSRLWTSMMILVGALVINGDNHSETVPHFRLSKIPPRPLFLLVGLALLIGMLSAANVAAADPQDNRIWRHGIVQPKGDAGFSFIVSKRNFGRKYGLNISIVPLKSGAIAQRALLAGRVDSVASGPGVGMLAASRGADVKIVGCDWDGVPQSLLVRPNIKNIEDLRGKTIAVASPGSLSNLLATAILQKYKIPETSVHFANLGTDRDRFKAVDAGVVDAGIVAREFLASKSPNVRQLVSGRDVVPNFVRSCFMIEGATLAKRRKDAVGFVAAEMDALYYAVGHREEIIQLTHEIIHDKASDPDPAFAYDDAVNNHTIDPTVAIPLNKLDWMQAELVRSGTLRKPLDISKVVDASIRREALKQTGH